MLFVKERIGNWVTAAIVLVLGILCIVAGAKMGGDNWEAAADALDGISITIGIVFIVVGSILLILAGVVAFLVKKGFLSPALAGGATLAVGISLVVAKYASNLIFIFLTVLPYLAIVLGAIILLYAIYNLVLALKSKGAKAAVIAAIVVMIFAIAAIVLGALCVGDEPVIKLHVQLIVLGIVAVVAAALMVLLTFVKVPDVVVVAVKPSKEK